MTKTFAQQQPFDSNNIGSIAIPSITMPKGGGALKGIDEKLNVNTISGGASISFPIPTAQARGMEPGLSLSYSTSAGNGPFGQGWSLSLLGISRRTARELPRYDDDYDVFILSGSEDLVPKFKTGADGKPIPDSKVQGAFLIDEYDAGDGTTARRYMPRREGQFARIERLTSRDGSVSWKVTSRENVTVILGCSDDSRLTDPEDQAKVYMWLPELAYDNLGNCSRYFYRKDISPDGSAQIYPDRIVYTNRKAWYPGDDIPSEKEFLFSTVFNYGQYDTGKDKEKPVGDWLIREDIISDRKPGFEVRTARLCRSVLLFSHMEEVPGGLALLKEMELGYDESGALTQLTSIRINSFRKKEDLSYSSLALPPTTFEYTPHSYNSKVEDADSIALPEGSVFCDLLHEGLPGILYKSHESGDMIYRNNLGGGHFSKPYPVASVPNGKNFVLLDLDADGKTQLADITPSSGGFYEIDGASLSPFKPFAELPNINSSDANVRFVDLNGDGRAEMLVSSDSVYLWYPSKGREGYDAANRWPLSINDADGPNLVFSDAEGSVFLADMTGDGLVDIVRIRRNETYYYPNLGYGRFGKKVTMDNAPSFGADYDPRRLRLADIDGTGTADLMYLGDEDIRCYLNLTGRGFAEKPFVIQGVKVPNILSDLQVCDILGNGTVSLVWTSALPAEGMRQIRYIDLMSGRKPYLLKSYSNSTGKEVHFEYKPSTAFYLEDRQSGNPWQTKLGFPVHCLHKVETVDLISGWRFVCTYRYRDGYFDSYEREFRGFSMVEKTDTEDFEHWTADSSNKLDASVHQPPVISRIWSDTGSGQRNECDLTSLCVEGLEDMTNDESREAHLAARGDVFRNEVYQSGMDSPCTTIQSTTTVRMLQPKGQNRHAVFLPLQKQTVATAFEDNADDPRVTQSINLKYDCYGELLESVSIAYPRRLVDNDAPEEVRASQSKTVILLGRDTYSNDVISEETYCLRSKVSSYSYELTGDISIPKGRFFTAEDFSGIFDSGRLRLLSGNVKLYAGADLKTPLPAGLMTFPAVAFESYTLAFTPDKLESIYGGKVSAEMLEEAKYVRLDNALTNKEVDGAWWIPSGRAWLADDGEDAEAARRRFYAPLKYTDRFGAPTFMHYYGDSWMIQDRIENAFDEKVSIEKYDFIAMAPTVIKDPNGNMAANIFDELGMTKASALLGKGDEADSLDGFTAETGDEEKSEIRKFFAATDPDEIIAIARRLLKKASIRHLYDYDCYAAEGIPARSATIEREQHYADNPDSPVCITIQYTNGCGTSILTKVQAEPGQGDNSRQIRWIGNGRSIVNNKGSIVKQYEPYFCDTPAFESEKEVVERGVTPIMHYDALGRNIRTDYPDGSFDKTEIHSWSITTYDTGDTVKDSEWYAKRMALDSSDPRHQAAVKSERYHGTPGKSHLDVLGRVTAIESAGLVQISRHDVEGNLLVAIDPRGNEVQRFKYDMIGRSLLSDGPDNGRRILLPDADGEPVREWNDRGMRIEYAYDILRRPVTVKVVTEALQEGEEAMDNIVARWRYGEDCLGSESLESLQARNLLGEVTEAWDTAGKVMTEGYDFKGLPTVVTRRMTKDFKHTVNWTEDRLESDLEDESFAARTKTDALGRMTDETMPDGSAFHAKYNAGGLLASESLHMSGENTPELHIKNAVYNEKRQRSFVEYGNGVTIEYRFDKETFRVEEAIVRKADGTTLSDLRYVFDVAGNLSHVSDASGKTVYHANAKVDPDSDYIYDELYRLVKASGRERAASAVHDAFDRWHDSEFRLEIEDMDRMAVRNYSEEYEYDASGNITSMKHSSEGNSWRRTFNYSDDSNRLLSTSVGSSIYRYSYHPRHGFMTEMPHLSRLAWNYADQLSSTSRQVRTDGGVPETTYYQYDGTGRRVRKVTICANDSRDDVLKDERIYIGGYEVYRKHSGASKGLERVSVSLIDNGERFVTVEKRNEVDDGTEARLVRYQISNHLGSSCMEIDDKGRIISMEEYTPYGSTSFQAWNKSIKAATKRYRFTGMERDDETGLSYHGARYYMPWLGRWLSADPAGISGGINLYCYCNGNPVTSSDPTGNDGWDRFFGALQLVGGVIEIVGGVAAIMSGVGVVAGVVAVAHGFDNTFHATMTVITGESQNTWTQDLATAGAEALGVSSGCAQVIGIAVDTFIGLRVDKAISKAANKGLREAAKVSAEKGSKAMKENLNVANKHLRKEYSANRAANTHAGDAKDYARYMEQEKGARKDYFKRRVEEVEKQVAKERATAATEHAAATQAMKKSARGSKQMKMAKKFDKDLFTSTPANVLGYGTAATTTFNSVRNIQLDSSPYPEMPQIEAAAAPEAAPAAVETAAEQVTETAKPETAKKHHRKHHTSGVKAATSTTGTVAAMKNESYTLIEADLDEIEVTVYQDPRIPQVDPKLASRFLYPDAENQGFCFREPSPGEWEHGLCSLMADQEY